MLITTLLFLVLSGVVAPAAQAHNDPYGYTRCTWSDKLASGNIRVGFMSPPGDWTTEGTTMSFSSRAADATARIGNALQALSSSGNGLTWVGTVSASNTASIAFRSQELDGYGTGVLGRAFVPPGCLTVHATPKQQHVGSIYIGLDERPNWFTQPNDRRELWESCPSNAETRADYPYTCSLTYDLGSIMIHELGHVIGIAHPLAVDSHQFSPPSTAMQIGKCNIANDQATMCHQLAQYRTHWRTLHYWDTQSIDRQY